MDIKSIAIANDLEQWSIDPVYHSAVVLAWTQKRGILLFQIVYEEILYLVDTAWM